MKNAFPSTLRETQEWLAATILAGTEPSAESPRPFLAKPPRGDIGERLGVYAGGYPARVEEALRETYPAVAHLIGRPAFARLGNDYVRRGGITRHSYNLNHVGAELPRFLASHELTEALPFLPDLALLEWGVAVAFHAMDEEPFEVARLAAWKPDEWDSAVLELQPSVSLVRSAWPIVALWEARSTPRQEIEIDLKDRPACALVHRRDLDVVCEAIAPEEADCLDAILRGEDLGEVAIQIAGADPHIVAEWFARWMTVGMVRDVRSTRLDHRSSGSEGLSGSR
jgi:hypothetical protein